MRKTIQVGLLAMVVSVLTTESLALAADTRQMIPPDYQYRTSRQPEAEPEKTMWDYLAFFRFKPDPEAGQQLPAAEAEELRARSRELVHQLVLNAKEALADEYILTVNTFVNLNNLYKTSSLGRYLGEQMLGELQAAGIEVIDVRKSKELMIREGYGEYGLSRDIDELGRHHGSQAMVVGTYTYANGQILVNARVLRNSDGLVISHANLAFALDPMTAQLLKDEAMPPRRGGMVKIEAVN